MRTESTMRTLGAAKTAELFIKSKCGRVLREADEDNPKTKSTPLVAPSRIS